MPQIAGGDAVDVGQEHRPPLAVVLGQQRLCEASAMALEERGGWGKRERWCLRKPPNPTLPRKRKREK
jgi:hypothetical protein